MTGSDHAIFNREDDMKKMVLLAFLLIPLQLAAITNMKANGQTELTITSVPAVLQITAELSRNGAMLRGGVYADNNQNGVFDAPDFPWNWRYGYLIDGVGWIQDPEVPLAAILGDEGLADGRLNVLFPLLRQQVKFWPNGRVFIFLQDEDDSFGLVTLNLKIAPSGPAIAGKLTDASTSAPIANMAMMAVKPSDGTTFIFVNGRSDAQGNFLLLVDPGSWDLYIDGAGEGSGPYRPAQETGIQITGSQILTRNVAMERYPAVVNGYVRHDDGTPANHVLLYAPGINYYIARTDSTGYYELGVEPGFIQLSLAYNLLANYGHLAEYYPVPQFSNLVVSAGETRADVMLKKYPAFLSGRCTLDGKGVIGAQLNAYFTDPVSGNSMSSAALSGPDGSFLIGVMPGTTSSLDVTGSGLDLAVPAAPYTNITAAAGDTVKGLDYQFQLAAGTNQIKGTVVGPAGQPAAGIYVAAIESETLYIDSYFFQYTNAQGEFDFSGLKNGQWRIGIFKFGALVEPAMSYYTLDGGRIVSDARFTLSGFTGAAAPEVTPPLQFGLEQNFPNPFNNSTEIRFTLTEPGQVNLAIYNTQGRLVWRLERETFTEGAQRIRWDGRDVAGRELASGLYIYALQAEGRIASGKMVLIR